MLDFLLNILKPLWAPILGALGVALAVLGAYAKGRSEQAARGKIVAQKETIDAYKTRDAVDASVSDADRQRLRDKWSRD